MPPTKKVVDRRQAVPGGRASDSEIPAHAPDQIEDDGYDAFFDDPDGAAYVDVIRMSPEAWRSVPVKGYLGRLNPGESFQTIKETYGGGRFRLNKRDSATGRMIQSITVDVAGPPLVVSPSSDDPPSAVPVVGNPRGTFDLDVNGTKVALPLPEGSWGQQLVGVLAAVRAIDAMFPKPVDLNSVLVQTLLENKNSANPFETVTKIAGAAEALGFSKGGGGGDGGEVNGWTILNTALDKAGDVISNLVRNNGAGPRPRPMVRRPVVPVDTQRPALPEPDGSDNTNPNPESEAVEPMNDLQVGMAMIGEIVKAYSLDPPKEPGRVVRMLDQMFRLEKAQRARIVGWKDTAFDIAENQLSDLFSEVPDRRAAFAEWFDQVFDSFTDSSREPKFL